jgi:predicted esterase
MDQQQKTVEQPLLEVVRSTLANRPEPTHKPNPDHPGLPISYPFSDEHKSTLILLHGRGSSKGYEFGVKFEAAKTSTGQTLPELFPNTKFIFPTAKKRRAVAMDSATIHQWFDNVSVAEGEGEVREDLQIEACRRRGNT